MRPFLLSCILVLYSVISLAQNAAFTQVNLNSYDGLAGGPVCPTDITKLGNNWFALIPEPVNQDAGRLYKSEDGGQTWTKLDVIFPANNVNDDKMLQLAAIGNNLVVFSMSVFLNANNKLEQHILGHVSSDGGQTFDLVFEEIYIVFNNNNFVEIDGLDEANGHLFFYYKVEGVSKEQVFFSPDQGLSWQESTEVPWFCNDISRIAGDNGRYFIISNNLMCMSWDPLFFDAENNAWTPNGGGQMISCSVDGDIVRVCTDKGQVYRWNFVPYNFTETQLPFKPDAAMADNGFWYFNHGGHFYRAPWDDPANLTDAGVIPMIPTSYYNTYHYQSRFVWEGGRLFFFNDTPLESTDNGLSWNLASGDFPVTGGKVFALNGSYWFLHRDVLFRSADGFSWDLYRNAFFDAEGTYGAFDMLESQGRLFLSCIEYYTKNNSRVLRSDDNGQSWQTVWEGADRPELTKDVHGDRLILVVHEGNVGTPPQTMLYSDDLGDTWAPIPVAGAFNSVAVKGDSVFVYQKPWVKYSYDLGQTWQICPQSFPFQYSGQILLFPNGKVVLVNKTTQIGYMSPDGGQTFGQIFDLQNFGTVLNASNYTQKDSLLIGWGSSGTFISQNQGLNWIYILEGDWLDIQHPVIQNGFLYTGSSGNSLSFMDLPLRTPLQPLLDQLALVSEAGGVVKGKTYYDVNGDCNALADPKRPNEIFSFQPGNYVCTSDSDGNVVRILPQGSYQIQYGTPLYHDPICLAPGPIAVTPGNQTNFMLGFKPNQQIKDLMVTLVSTRARPGQAFHVTALIRNLGTQPIAAGTVLTLTFPEPPVLFTNAQPQANNQAAGQLQFMLPDIPPYIELHYKIHLALPPDPGLMGQILQINADLATSFQDPTPTNNSSTQHIVVFNSFDPNDKTAITSNPTTGVMPIRDQSLQYMIRFQNTGTDTAFRIVVRDTLSGLLNWNSLKTIGASHEYRLTITDAGVVSWHFDNIRLVDSTTNEPESHGFILFGIEPKPGIRVGDILRNKAAIYFDFNHPVITNETVTPIVLRSKYRNETAQEQEFQADISPNPVADQLRCRLQLPYDTHVRAILFDVKGQAIRQVSDKDYPAGEQWLEARLQDLPAGVYSLQLIMDGELKTLTMVKG
ncbi:MAG TPA: hypothetical protein VK168_14095 [Saprospiraceae bacterium]|nr:hypothetical protein [Saprospiraceae bacterium]